MNRVDSEIGGATREGLDVDINVRGGRGPGKKSKGLGNVQLRKKLNTIGFNATAIIAAIAQAIVPRLG